MERCHLEWVFPLIGWWFSFYSYVCLPAGIYNSKSPKMGHVQVRKLLVIPRAYINHIQILSIDYPYINHIHKPYINCQRHYQRINVVCSCRWSLMRLEAPVITQQLGHIISDGDAAGEYFFSCIRIILIYLMHMIDIIIRFLCLTPSMIKQFRLFLWLIWTGQIRISHWPELRA